jgi:hypothetical protein
LKSLLDRDADLVFTFLGVAVCALGAVGPSAGLASGSGGVSSVALERDPVEAASPGIASASCWHSEALPSSPPATVDEPAL